MSQAAFIKPVKGKARVIIKSNHEDDGTKFELDWEMSKPAAVKLLMYAIELKVKEEKHE